MLPQKVKIVDTKELEKSCEQFIQWLNSKDYHEDEIECFEHDIYEKAIEAFYGESVSSYIDSKIV